MNMGRYKKGGKIRKGEEDTRRLKEGYETRTVEVIDIMILTDLNHNFYQ